MKQALAEKQTTTAIEDSPLISSRNGNIPEKIAVRTIASKDETSSAFQKMYSEMKHGNPIAVRSAAILLANKIYNQLFKNGLLSFHGEVAITSSAFGEVPTASYAVMKEVMHLLKTRGIELTEVKINRKGDFETTNYGSMDIEERLSRMQDREIFIDEINRNAVKGKVVIMIDDVNVTGSHERNLKEVMLTTEASALIFCYLIDFADELAFSEPHTEDFFNNAAIKNVSDLKHFSKDTATLIVNARTIKFILNTEGTRVSNKAEKITALRKFLTELNNEVLKKIYTAATSADGYCFKAKFIDGFNMLGDIMISRRILKIEDFHKIKNSTVLNFLTVDESGNLLDMITGENLNQFGECYSRMKFGSHADIHWLGVAMANKVISRLNDSHDSLIKTFEIAKKRNQHIAMISPGSRNIESAQNFIFEVAIKHINVWLAIKDLPTLVMIKLTRFGSGTANYAQLSAVDRMVENRGNDNNKQFLPGTDFFSCGLHVVFADDVRITGAAADWIEVASLEKGAQSFLSLYCTVVDPLYAMNNPAIEHFLNQFLIKGGLDNHVSNILNQEQFRPVQRMMRLILSEANRPKLKGFLKKEVCNASLLKLYESSLGNDYLRDDRYADSLTILKQVAIEKDLICADGCLKNN